LRDELKGDISSLRSELKGDISSLRSELKGDISSLRDELKGDLSSLKGDIAALARRVDKLEETVIGLQVALGELRGGVAELSGMVHASIAARAA
ncbi:MAG: hypothetical protein ACRDF8_07435, partial [Chloroflexota bacterium]